LLSNLTTTLTTLIQDLYISTGLLGIVLAMAIESCCIPLPSEIVMPIAGILIASGKLLHGTNQFVSLLLVALAGAVGCLIGSTAAYGIGYSGGRPLMLKYGRYVLISQHDADQADKFFQRWGSATAFFSRLLPVVRTYISLPAGISKMPFVKFCVYSFLGSFPWCFALAFLGVQLGNHLDTLSPIFHDLDIVIVIAVVALVALYIWRHIRNDRKARAEHAAQGTATETASSWQQQAAAPQNWNQQAFPQQPQQWGQQQPFSSPIQGQNGWNAPASQQFPPTPSQPQMPSQQPSQFQQQWGQQPQQMQPQQQGQQGWNQPSQPQWGQSPTQANGGQQPQQPPQQNWPPQTDDRSVRR
jgi:membrane protein DedA with SNARE-associated domain